MSDTYVALDLEMTGLSPKLDKIIEIGAVSVKDGKIKDTFSSFVNPGRELPEKIMEITGIRQEDVENAPKIGRLLTDLSDFIGDRDLVGHSILSDFAFLKKAYVNHGLGFEKKGIDTLKLARKYLPELPSKRLPDICAHYGIAQQAHRALEDARAVHILFEKLKENFYDEEVFRAQPLIYQVKKEAPAGKWQKERLLSLIRKHKLYITIDLESMSKNEVSRLTDQILAKYGR